MGLRHVIGRIRGLGRSRDAVAHPPQDPLRVDGRDVPVEYVELDLDGDIFTCAIERDASDPYADWIRSGAHSDGPVTWARRLVADDEEVLDLGANVGVFSFAVARHARRVVAVEAHPTNFALLARGVSVNRLPVVPVHAAAWSEPGEVSVTGSSAWGQVGQSGDGSRVTALTVAQIVDRFHSEPPALVKLDIEGAEEAVLPHVFSCLADRDRCAVIYESNQFATSRSVTILHEIARDFGCDLWTIDHSDGTASRLLPDMPQTAVYCDVVALRGRSHPLLPSRPPTADEITQQLVREVSSTNAVHRGYVVAAIDQFPAAVRANLAPFVREARHDQEPAFLRSLRHHENVFKT